MGNSDINDGGPAFPSDKMNPGMTLRDWMAGQALSGLLTNNNFLVSLNDPLMKPTVLLSLACYEIADYMIAQRHQQEESDDDDNNA